MNTNNPSDKIKDRDLNEDVNENANEKKNEEPGNVGRMQDSSQRIGPGNMLDNRRKGTGMSSESGSSQSEKSWQGPGGSQGTSHGGSHSNQFEKGSGSHNQGNTGT